MIRNIYDVIELVRKRPSMYLGVDSISRLRSFLNGYCFAVYFNNDIEYDDKLIPLPFGFFNDFIAEKFNVTESIGWSEILLRQVNQNEEDGLKLFFELFDKYKNITIEQSLRADLNENGINRPRCESINYIQGAVAVYEFVLSGENGWILAVENEDSIYLDWYNDDNELFETAAEAFGQLNWKKTDFVDICSSGKKLYRR